MSIAIVAAVARNGVIGVDNRLPWHLPADLRRFRALTLGKPVVMGRRTHESIGKPLPGRRNIVITRHGEVMAGCERAASFEEALLLASGADEIMVIGGRRCFRDALPIAERLYLTEIGAEFEGDTWFPEWTPSEWAEVCRERGPPHERAPFVYEFVVWERQSTARIRPD